MNVELKPQEKITITGLIRPMEKNQVLGIWCDGKGMLHVETP